jgi:hypothetical protein
MTPFSILALAGFIWLDALAPSVTSFVRRPANG